MAGCGGWQPRRFGDANEIIFIRDDLQPYPGGGFAGQLAWLKSGQPPPTTPLGKTLAVSPAIVNGHDRLMQSILDTGKEAQLPFCPPWHDTASLQQLGAADGQGTAARLGRHMLGSSGVADRDDLFAKVHATLQSRQLASPAAPWTKEQADFRQRLIAATPLWDCTLAASTMGGPAAPAPVPVGNGWRQAQQNGSAAAPVQQQPNGASGSGSGSGQAAGSSGHAQKQSQGASDSDGGNDSSSQAAGSNGHAQTSSGASTRQPASQTKPASAEPGSRSAADTSAEPEVQWEPSGACVVDISAPAQLQGEGLVGGAGGSRLVNTTVEASWVTVTLDTVDGLKEVSMQYNDRLVAAEDVARTLGVHADADTAADEATSPGVWLSADPKDGGVTGLVAKPLQGSDLAEAALEAAAWLWSALSGVQYTGDDDAVGGELFRLDGAAYASPLVEHQRLMAADKPYRAAFLSVAQVSCLFTLESDTDVLVQLRSARLARRRLPADDISRVHAQALPGSAIPLTLALSLRVVDFFGDVHHISGDAAAAHQLFKPYAAAAAALADVSQFEHLCPALQALGEVAKVVGFVQALMGLTSPDEELPIADVKSYSRAQPAARTLHLPSALRTLWQQESLLRSPLPLAHKLQVAGHIMHSYDVLAGRETKGGRNAAAAKVAQAALLCAVHVVMASVMAGPNAADPYQQLPRACLLLARHALLGTQMPAEAFALLAGWQAEHVPAAARPEDYAALVLGLAAHRALQGGDSALLAQVYAAFGALLQRSGSAALAAARARPDAPAHPPIAVAVPRWNDEVDWRAWSAEELRCMAPAEVERQLTLELYLLISHEVELDESRRGDAWTRNWQLYQKGDSVSNVLQYAARVIERHPLRELDPRCLPAMSRATELAAFESLLHAFRTTQPPPQGANHPMTCSEEFTTRLAMVHADLVVAAQLAVASGDPGFTAVQLPRLYTALAMVHRLFALLQCWAQHLDAWRAMDHDDAVASMDMVALKRMWALARQSMPVVPRQVEPLFGALVARTIEACLRADCRPALQSVTRDASRVCAEAGLTADGERQLPAALWWKDARDRGLMDALRTLRRQINEYFQ